MSIWSLQTCPYHGALAGALHLLDSAELAQGRMAARQKAHASGPRQADEAALAGIDDGAVLVEDAVNNNRHAAGVQGDRALGACDCGRWLWRCGRLDTSKLGQSPGHKFVSILLASSRYALIGEDGVAPHRLEQLLHTGTDEVRPEALALSLRPK